MWSLANREEFLACIADLIVQPEVQEMANVHQHVDVNCLEHCVFVSYISFLFCKRFGLNFVDAARGTLLHDLFLYDWHIKGSHKGLHGFTHPKTALQNASKICDLTEKEKDIIVKHMWPLTIRLPKYRESFVVSGADKLCALAEMLHIYHILKVGLRLNVVPAAAAL